AAFRDIRVQSPMSHKAPARTDRSELVASPAPTERALRSGNGRHSSVQRDGDEKVLVMAVPRVVQTQARHAPQPLVMPGDVDGFFGLAIDNLIQFLLILGLCTQVLGFPLALVLQTILPGAALSIVAGNFFYSWQSQRLSAATGRRDVTALPYGINTVSLFAFV